MKTIAFDLGTRCGVYIQNRIIEIQYVGDEEGGEAVEGVFTNEESKVIFLNDSTKLLPKKTKRKNEKRIKEIVKSGEQKLLDFLNEENPDVIYFEMIYTIRTFNPITKKIYSNGVATMRFAKLIATIQAWAYLNKKKIAYTSNIAVDKYRKEKGIIKSDINDAKIVFEICSSREIHNH